MRVDENENMTSPHISDIDKAAVDPAMCVVVLKFVLLFLLLLSFRTVPSPTDRRQYSGSPVVKSGLGQDSSVGIASRCRLDGPGIEFRWGARFSAPVQTGPGSHPASCTMGTGSFPGG